MSTNDATTLVRRIGRCELYENTPVYLKAVRTTMIELGYDPIWVENEFKKLLENEYVPGFPITKG